MYQNFIIPYLYETQHVSGDTPPIIRSLKLHKHCAWQRPPTTRPTTFHVCKTRGCQCSFRLLIMGGVSPETCWASYKYGIIKFWYIVASCWTFLYELYYDAWIHECQIIFNFSCTITLSLQRFRKCSINGQKFPWYFLSRTKL